MLSPQTFQQAQMRFANYYCQRIQVINTVYTTDFNAEKNILVQLNDEFSQIQQGQWWATTNTHAGPDVLQMANDYAGIHGDLLDQHIMPDEKIAWYQSGLDAARMLDDMPSMVQHLCSMGMTFTQLSAYDDAFKYYQDGVNLAQNLDDPTLYARARSGLAGVLHTRGEPDEAEPHIAAVLATIEPDYPVSLQIEIYRTATEIYYSLTNIPAAQENADKMLTLAQQSGNRAFIAAALYLRGLIYYLISDYDKARAMLQEGREMAQAVNHLRTVAWCLVYLGSIAVDVGDLNEAEALAIEGGQLAQMLGDIRMEAIFINNYAHVSEFRGRSEDAANAYMECLALCEAIGDLVGQSIALKGYADNATVLERYDEAMDAYQQGLAISREVGDEIGVARTYFGIGDMEIHREHYADATKAYQAGYEIVKPYDIKQASAVALRGLGLALMKMGEFREGLAYTVEALTIVLEMEIMPMLSIILQNTAFALYDTPLSTWSNRLYQAARTYEQKQGNTDARMRYHLTFAEPAAAEDLLTVGQAFIAAYHNGELNLG